jgi:hypothetical protein
LTTERAGTTASSDGALFRYAGGGTWVNNLGTRGWTAGTYLVTIEVADGRRYRAALAVK